MRSIRLEKPHAALDWVLAHSSDETKPMLFRDLLMATAKDADNSVFDVFESLIEKEGYEAFRKDFRIDDIFWGTSGLDYERGINWVNSLPKDVYGWRYMAPSMVFAWSHHDRKAAQEFTQTIEDPKVRQRMNSSIVHNMLSTSQDFEQTWDFVSSLPADQHANDYAKLLDRWARLYPGEASRRIASIPEEGAESAIQSVAANWGALAPTEAVEWLGSLESQGQRDLAIQAIAASWAKSDLYAVSEWIGGLAAGDGRDLAAAELVNEVAPYEGGLRLSLGVRNWWRTNAESSPVDRRYGMGKTRSRGGPADG